MESSFVWLFFLVYSFRGFTIQATVFCLAACYHTHRLPGSTAMYWTATTITSPAHSLDHNFPFGVQIRFPRIGACLLSAFEVVARLTTHWLPWARLICGLCTSSSCCHPSQIQIVDFSEANGWSASGCSTDCTNRGMPSNFSRLFSKAKQLCLCFSIESFGHSNGNCHIFHLGALISHQNLDSSDYPCHIREIHNDGNTYNSNWQQGNRSSMWHSVFLSLRLSLKIREEKNSMLARGRTACL